MLSRVILGARGALEVALIVVVLAAAIGVPLGLVAGYRSGWLSEAIMRVTDVFLAAAAADPGARLGAADDAVAGKRDAGAGADLLAVLHPAGLRRDAATALLAVRRRAARHRRRRPRASCFVHILPNAISPIIVRATIGMGFTILVAAVLGFLGMGATPPAARLGADHRRKPQLSAGRVVVLDLPGPGHPRHGARLQPAGRWVARPCRSAAAAVAMSGRSTDPSRSARPAPSIARRRGHRRDPRPYRFRARARAHPGGGRRIGLRQIDA